MSRIIFSTGVILLLMASVGVTDQTPAVNFAHQIIDPKGPKNPWVKIVGDIDGDHFVDVIVGGQSGPLVWYAYPGWTKTEIAKGGYDTVDGEVGDVDRDGDLDVILGGVFWYENPGPKGHPATDSWKTHKIGTHRTHDLEVCDLDGDGDLDVVTRDQSGFGNKTGNTIHFWRQNSPDSWTERIVNCPHGEGLTLGDVDRDGDLDVIIGGFWYENDKDILQGRWDEYGYGAWHEDAVVKMADLNADSRPDIVLTRSEGPYKLSWFEAPADPKSDSWKEHVIDDSVDFAHGLEIADLDRDGDPDIVASEMHQSSRKRVLVFWNDDKGSRWSPQVLSTKGSHNIRAADIGNDGDIDIVGANWSGDDQPIECWINPIIRP